MKYILLTLFLTICLGARAQQEDKPVFVYGFEWGGTLNYFHRSYLLFLTAEQYLAESRSQGWMSYANGFLSGSAGVALRNMEVMAYAGYHGFYRHIQMPQIGIRTNIHRNRSREGFFGYVDGSIGIPLFSNNKAVPYTAAGAGYRVRLSKHICMDHKIGICNALVSPRELKDPYSGNMIEPDNIRESRTGVLGIRFSVGFIL